jgi:hypothetical protein
LQVSKALEKVALEKGLQLHVTWLNKCIQLYETYLVSKGGISPKPAHILPALQAVCL